MNTDRPPAPRRRIQRFSRRLRRLLLSFSPLREAVTLVLSPTRTLTEPGKGELRTLCYHSVTAKTAPGLDRQFSFLKNYGDFIGPDDGLELLARDRFDGRYFLVTFDDGYHDVLDHALPILVDHGVPAIMFIISLFLIDPPSQGQWAGKRYFTPEDCRRWLAAGMKIGSHSHTHPRLSGLSDEQSRGELQVSRAALSHMTGTKIRHFACPWGSPNDDYLTDRDPELAAQVGYSTFFTTTRGPARSGDNPYQLPRDVVEPAWSCNQLRYFFGH